MRIWSYAGMRACGCEIYGYRAGGFVVCGNRARNSGLAFSHPIPLSIGYWFFLALLILIATGNLVSGIWFYGVSFILYLMPSAIGESARA